METNSERGELVDIILSNNIYSVSSVTDQMYRIGSNEAFITIQCDSKGNELTAFCIKHSESSTKYIKFDNSEDAKFVSSACKQRLAAQEKEQAKIDKFNQQRINILIKEQRKIDSFNRRFR
jgi:hypothetical protein